MVEAEEEVVPLAQVEWEQDFDLVVKLRRFGVVCDWGVVGGGQHTFGVLALRQTFVHVENTLEEKSSLSWQDRSHKLAAL